MLEAVPDVHHGIEYPFHRNYDIMKHDNPDLEIIRVVEKSNF
jgi:hypothetical protein